MLELLVALGITAFVLGLVGSSMLVSMRANERAVEQMELLQRLRETMNRITTDVTAVTQSQFRPDLTPFKSFDIDTTNQPFDAMTFTTLAYRSYKPDAHEPDFVSMTYFVKEDENRLGPDDTAILMHRIGGTINDSFEVEGGMVYPVVFGLTRFELDYLEPESEWRHEWVTGDRGGALPCAVRVKLGMKSMNMEEITLTAVIPLVLTTSECEFERDTILMEF